MKCHSTPPKPPSLSATPSKSRISVFFFDVLHYHLFSAAEDEGVQVQYDFGFDVAAVRHGCGELVNGGLEFVAAVRSDSRDFDGVAEREGGFGGVEKRW